jgi:hypothetical protein
MNASRNDALLLVSRALIVLIQAVMAISSVGVAITLGLVAFTHESLNAELRLEYGPEILAMPYWPMLSLLAVALGITVLIFLFFGKLRGIIGTVATGDPFVPENADRLSAMAWLQIGIYALGFAAKGVALLIADWAEQFTDFDIESSLDIDPPAVLLILVLFILARVFKHGAAMREDLEGTV